ncbi:MAG: bifunctional DNA-formamidopyrimidine glycosylase/DNA-(apurinic or apyrimidinic site) lyase [Phycisphaerales bacterium]
MPELPEVERVRLSLKSIRRRTIVRAKLLRADIAASFSESGRARSTTPSHLLQGATISTLLRRGKQLAITTTDNRALCIQFGMSGRMLLQTSDIPHPTSDIPKHTHALWTFDDNSRLLFIDPRRFGGLAAYPSSDALLTHRWSTLGPDALAITAHDLAAACKDAHRPIKSLLLDQSALAGVGNIYADESLFLARVHPARSAHSLAPKELTALASAIRFILQQAVRAGGSTIRSYLDATGSTGSAQNDHKVYGRANEPCTICRRPLSSSRLVQRATVFCVTCQPRRPA